MHSYCYAVLVKSTTNSAVNNSSMIPATKELFSVAPMMAHTNCRYHYFFRLLSSWSHLYTEMIPAAQIVALKDDHDRINDLLRIHPSNGPSCITLQLGGKDVDILAEASRIGTSYGYKAINLNCGWWVSIGLTKIIMITSYTLIADVFIHFGHDCI